MNKLLIFLFLIVCFSALGQEQDNADSVEVRILNKGKHYIKEHTITLKGRDYQFTDIWPKKYSEYKRLPYFWTNIRSKTTVIKKRLFRYDEWLTTELWPIDHVGEQKYLSSKLSIEVRTKVKFGQLEIVRTVTVE